MLIIKLVYKLVAISRLTITCANAYQGGLAKIATPNWIRVVLHHAKMAQLASTISADLNVYALLDMKVNISLMKTRNTRLFLELNSSAFLARCLSLGRIGVFKLG